MKKFATLFLLVSMVLSNLNAQRDCSIMDNLKHLKKIYPEINQEMQEIERHTHNYVKDASLRSGNDEVITIPVVVHVLYNTTSENITDQVIQSQIDVLNEDFRRINSDQTNDWKQAADVNIEFKLAKFGPTGNSTSGINRRFTSKSYFNPNNQMKYARYGGADAWPANQYLNIWVCDLRGNKMGYAQFPGGPKATDGVVIDYAFFGRTSANSRYGLGRTTTHEIGHWLNLRHIWGDGDCSRDDYVSDTPSASYASYGCQEGKVSCGSLDMVSNFMDYSYDRCMNLFTEGQKIRMRALFSRGGSREPLLQSHALGAPEDPRGDIVQSAECEDCEEAEDEKPDICPAPQNLDIDYSGRYLKASWEGESDQYLFELKPSFSTKWFSFKTNRKSITIAGITASMQYKIRIKTVCDDGSESPPIDASRYSGLADRKTNEGLSFVNPAVGFIQLQWSPDFFAKEAVQQRNTVRLVMVDPDNLDHIKEAPEISEIRVRKIQLYDLGGRLVVDAPVRTGVYNKDIPVRHLQTGLYIMTFSDASDRILHRTKVHIQSSR